MSNIKNFESFNESRLPDEYYKKFHTGQLVKVEKGSYKDKSGKSVVGETGRIMHIDNNQNVAQLSFNWKVNDLNGKKKYSKVFVKVADLKRQ